MAVADVYALALGGEEEEGLVGIWVRNRPK